MHVRLRAAWAPPARSPPARAPPDRPTDRAWPVPPRGNPTRPGRRPRLTRGFLAGRPAPAWGCHTPCCPCPAHRARGPKQPCEGPALRSRCPGRHSSRAQEAVMRTRTSRAAQRPVSKHPAPNPSCGGPPRTPRSPPPPPAACPRPPHAGCTGKASVWPPLRTRAGGGGRRPPGQGRPRGDTGLEDWPHPAWRSRRKRPRPIHSLGAGPPGERRVPDGQEGSTRPVGAAPDSPRGRGHCSRPHRPVLAVDSRPHCAAARPGPPHAPDSPGQLLASSDQPLLLP